MTDALPRRLLRSLSINWPELFKEAELLPCSCKLGYCSIAGAFALKVFVEGGVEVYPITAPPLIDGEVEVRVVAGRWGFFG